MSKASVSFNSAIQDAQVLLVSFDLIKTQAPQENGDVLKKAALVMALTAWETYVEDRVWEGLTRKLSAVAGSSAGNSIQNRLRNDLKQFPNPNAENTRKLFLDYLEIDVMQGWNWENTEPEKAKKLLNERIAKRSEAVHRAKAVNNGSPVPHLVKREELVKAIRFVKELVNATEVHLNRNLLE